MGSISVLIDRPNLNDGLLAMCLVASAVRHDLTALVRSVSVDSGW